MKTYARLPVGFVRGQGVWLWDESGRRYLDALAGIAVAVLGHAHPRVTEAIVDQAGTLLHTSNLYRIPVQEQLGERLSQISGMDRVFFGNSGAEANEAAIKLARRYGHAKGIETPVVLVTEGAFHGRTLATLTATANRKVHAGFEPLVKGFKRVPYDDLQAVRQIAALERNIVAILVEPIQGEGGIVMPSPGYLKGLSDICRQHGWLLMLDEIQTGMGRTGRWFAFQHEDVQPDVVTLAKALGNGIPIGACLARGEAAEVLQPGSHGSTFGGNPFVCRVALTVIEALEAIDALGNAARQGDRIVTGLEKCVSGSDGMRSVRGKGLMIGLELNEPCAQLVKTALDRQLLINVTADSVVRLLPPLIYEDGHSDQLIESLGDVLTRFLDR